MNIETDVLLSAHTTFGIGGPARWFCECTDAAAVAEAVALAETNEVPFLVLGGGSNMLVSDDGFAGVVIKNNLVGITVMEETETHVFVNVGAGVVFDELVAWSVEEGYWGLENLSHIPGSVGATPIQNVGAYGVEIESVVHEVIAYDTNAKETKTFDTSACQFAYRDSFFKTDVGRTFVVLSVTYTLSKEPQPVIAYRDVAERFAGRIPTQQEIRDAIIAIRSAKFPDWHTVGTAGSFFKNPIISPAHYDSLLEKYPELPGFSTDSEEVKVPLGWILDKVCGLRGHTIGKVGSYQGQALVVVAETGATAAEVSAFATAVAAHVQEKTNIAIEWEVTRV